MIATRAALKGLALAAVFALGGCGQRPDAEAPAAAAPQTAAPAAAKPEFNIGWSIYAGWMPWAYAEQAGIVKKWADKYGITVNVVQINDYVESINQYTAGKLDGVTAASMDALTIPAAGGKDTTVLIIGDYSNGNDGIVLKNGASMADIKGRSVHLVELSVSHYLLARGLEMSGLTLPDVKTVNTGDADIVGAFASSDVTAVATWNPQLSELKNAKDATLVFDSSKIPTEILDTLAVSTDTLKANPNLGKALSGIWYETMAVMSGDDAKGKEARAMMAKLSGATAEGYEAQLKTTAMYYQAQDAVAYNLSPELVAATDRVRKFSFSQGLFGPAAVSVDAIGIEFPNGKTLGSTDNVKLRFDPSYMQLAADGAL